MLAAATTTPCTVRELAMRSQVAWGAAAWTACRLVQRGQLVHCGHLDRKPGGGRPAMLVALPSPEPRSDGPVDLAEAMRRFVEPPAQPPA